MHSDCLLDNGEQVFKDSCQAIIHAAALKAASNSPEQLLLVTICNGLRLGDAASMALTRCATCTTQSAHQSACWRMTCIETETLSAFRHPSVRRFVVTAC